MKPFFRRDTHKGEGVPLTKHQTCWTSRDSNVFSFPCQYFQDETDSDRRRFIGSAVHESAILHRSVGCSSPLQTTTILIIEFHLRERRDGFRQAAVHRFNVSSISCSVGPQVADLDSKSRPRFSSSIFICAKDETDSDRRRFIGQSLHRSVGRGSRLHQRIPSARKNPTPKTKSAVIHQQSAVFLHPATILHRSVGRGKSCLRYSTSNSICAKISSGALMPLTWRHPTPSSSWKI